MVKQLMPKAGEAILALFNKLGGNMNNVLGSRSNITFLGKGKTPEGFIDSDINVEAIGFLGKNKILEELESSIGYLTAGKLNDVQANKLLENMQKIDGVFNPPQISNITDLATGTRNLDQEGLASLRDPRGLRFDEDSGVLKSMVGKENASGLRIDPDLPPLGSRGEADDIAAPFQDAETTIRNLEKQDPELAAQFKAIVMGGNQGGNPAKRATAREFLVEALKKENPNQTSLADIISAEDVKYITEGGGGIAGDPLLLVDKYFGPRIRDLVPEGASSEEIVIFTQRVLNNVVDAAGNKPGSPDFDRLTARILDIDMPGGPEQPFADGGRAGFFGGGLGRLGKAGYQAIRKYGIEAEDITNLFKSLATDKSLVGKEKTEYFKMLNQVLKNPDDYPEGVREILIRLGKPVDFAEGGRVGFADGSYSRSYNPSAPGGVVQHTPVTIGSTGEGGDNPSVTIGSTGEGGAGGPIVTAPEQPTNFLDRGINIFKSIFGDDDEGESTGTGTVSQATVDAILNPEVASNFKKITTATSSAVDADPALKSALGLKKGGLAKILEL